MIRSEEDSRRDPSAKPIAPSQIRAGMKVLCSRDRQFGVVEQMDGPGTIRLRPDASGLTHTIPLAWVTRVDDAVHVDRPGDQAMREWSTAVGA